MISKFVQAPPEWKRQFGEQQAEIYASEISQIATNPAETRELMGRVTEIATGGIGEVTWDAEAILALAPGGTALRALLARRAAVGATEGTAAVIVGKGIPATSASARIGLREDLAVQAGIPRRLDQVWGSSIDDLVKAYEMDGATVARSIRAGTSGKAQVYTVEGHRFISKIQYHPGGGQHNAGKYYKFTYKDGVEVRVIDPNSGYSSGTITKYQRYYDTKGNRLKFEAGKWKLWD